MKERRPSEIILEVVPRVMHLIRSEMRLLAAQELTVPQFRVLANLQLQDRTASELAEWIGITLPAMSRMVELLHRKGLVARIIDPKDRRKAMLRPTARGRATFERIRAGVAASVDSKMRAMSPTDEERLLAGLDLLDGLIPAESLRALDS